MKKLKLNGVKARDVLADLRRQQVVALYRRGFKQTEIAEHLGITQARVSQILLTVERGRSIGRMLRLEEVDPIGVPA